VNDAATSHNDGTSSRTEVPSEPKHAKAYSRGCQSRRPATKDASQPGERNPKEKRDGSSFEEMFSASRLRFVRVAYNILQNHEDAEDAVQNALVSSYVNLGSFEGRSALKTWFTRVVLNAALMIRRKRKHQEIDSGPEGAAHAGSQWMEGIPSKEPDPEMSCARAETIGLIQGLIADLRPTLRQALTMCCLEEMPADQARVSLGVSTATFKARLFRARRQLISQARHFLADRSSNRLPHALRNHFAIATVGPTQSQATKGRFHSSSLLGWSHHQKSENDSDSIEGVSPNFWPDEYSVGRARRVCDRYR
jgi:RNA polymerase sigma-70 factor, ECF subfamily